MTEKKYNWIIVSGYLYEYNRWHLNKLNNLTKTQLGVYIKKNVKILFDHFLTMQRCDCIVPNGDKITDFMVKLNYYDKSKMSPDELTEEQYNEMVKIIETELEKYSDKDVVNNFNGAGEGYLFVTIKKLEEPFYKNFDSSHDDDSDSNLNIDYSD